MVVAHISPKSRRFGLAIAEGEHQDGCIVGVQLATGQRVVWIASTKGGSSALDALAQTGKLLVALMNPAFAVQQQGLQGIDVAARPLDRQRISVTPAASQIWFTLNVRVNP